VFRARRPRCASRRKVQEQRHRQQRRDAGGNLERDDMDDRPHPRRHRRKLQPAGRRVVPLGDGMRCRRGLRERPRQPSDVGGGLEREEVGDRTHPQPDRPVRTGERSDRSVVRLGHGVHRSRVVHRQPCEQRPGPDAGGGLERKQVGDRAHSKSARCAGELLSAVSCTSAVACTAVGSGAGPLAEAWNENRWAIEPTPSPKGASLNDLSCTSATACVAVGSSGEATLAERFR
jgi:hypothetical protein